MPLNKESAARLRMTLVGHVQSLTQEVEGLTGELQSLLPIPSTLSLEAVAVHAQKIVTLALKLKPAAESLSSMQNNVVQLDALVATELDPPDQTCTACSGSGYYDDDGSPPCGSCQGTGVTHD